MEVVFNLNTSVSYKLKKCSPASDAWSSLVEGDEQLDQPNIQTTMDLCHACVA